MNSVVAMLVEIATNPLIETKHKARARFLLFRIDLSAWMRAVLNFETPF